MRETAVRAAEGQLVTVSDVALLKRLRVSGEWFRWMGEELMRRWMTPRPVRPLLGAGRRVRIVDGSTVNEPGATGSTWRLHYAVGLPSLACEEVHVTDTTVGKSLCRFQVAAGDLLIADRGFANRNGVRHVHQHGGAVIVRLNLTNLPLRDGAGQPFALLPHLRTLSADRVGDWPVAVSEEKKGLPADHRAPLRHQKEQDGGTTQSRQGGARVATGWPPGPTRDAGGGRIHLRVHHAWHRRPGTGDPGDVPRAMAGRTDLQAAQIAAGAWPSQKGRSAGRQGVVARKAAGRRLDRDVDRVGRSLFSLGLSARPNSSSLPLAGDFPHAAPS